MIQSNVIRTPSHTLHRFFAVPTTPPIARIIVLHGYGDHAGKYLHFLAWMADHGILAEAADFRGHGRSTGRVAHVTRWEEYLDDLAAMLTAGRDAEIENGGSKIEDRGSRIVSQIATPSSDPRSSILEPLSSIVDHRSTVPTFIVAHSHGVLIAIIAALRGMLDGCAGVIMSAPFLELKMSVPWTKRIFVEAASKILPGIHLKSGIGGPMLTRDPIFIAEQKMDRYSPSVATPRWFTTARKMQAEALASAAQFKLPLLMLVPGDDTVADARASTAFFEQAGSTDKQIRHFPEHRHELLRELGREEIFLHMLDWISARNEHPHSIAGLK